MTEDRYIAWRVSDAIEIGWCSLPQHELLARRPWVRRASNTPISETASYHTFVIGDITIRSP